MTFDEFMKIVRETNEKNSHPENWTEAERLRHEIMAPKKSAEECVKLEEEVQAFLKSNASQEDKQTVISYAESLSMICTAIREERIDK